VLLLLCLLLNIQEVYIVCRCTSDFDWMTVINIHDSGFLKKKWDGQRLYMRKGEDIFCLLDLFVESLNCNCGFAHFGQSDRR
jgi:hypothetical protein